MGRFVNRPYRNYSLFISETASLFNIHSSQRIIPFAPSGNTVSHIRRSKSPPCLKGGRGDSVSLPRQNRAEGNVFRTPREGRPYGQTDKPHTVGRGLAPAEML